MTNVTPSSEPFSEPEKSVPEGPPHVEPTFEVAFEPLPQWDQARETWQWAWDLHWAGLGCMFALLALYALWSLIDLAASKHRRKPLLALAISSLLLLFGTTRAAFFFINPYESEECFLPTGTCPVILTRTLFGIALPCITASFFLVHLAFLQLSKLKLYPGKLQSVKFVTCVIAFHFALTLITEIMISMYADWKAFSIVCETFFIILSFILSVSFIYSGRIILKSVHESRSSVRRFSGLNDNFKHHPPPNVAKLVKITYVTVFLGITCVALKLYSIFVLHNMYSDDGASTPKPWPWLIFETSYRLIEFGLGCTMAYVNPRQASYRRRSLSGIFLMQCKLRAGSTLYIQNNQSSGDSGDLASPTPYARTSLPTVELGIVNEEWIRVGTGLKFVTEISFLSPFSRENETIELTKREMICPQSVNKPTIRKRMIQEGPSLAPTD